MSDELVKRYEDMVANRAGSHWEHKLEDDTLAGLKARDARIRLLEQQLSTAREALEPFANEAPRYDGDNDEDTAWETLPTVGELRRAAAAIRSLGEPGAHPPGK